MDAAAGEQEPQLSLAAVRDALVREEDSVVFALIERARHPRNAPAYAPAAGGGRSLVESFVRKQRPCRPRQASSFHVARVTLCLAAR
jgi:chorismate mutase